VVKGLAVTKSILPLSWKNVAEAFLQKENDHLFIHI
jgi:hypothetical protein